MTEITYFCSANEEDVDSPANLGEGEISIEQEVKCHDSEIQYGELTVQNFWPRVTEEIRKINVVNNFKFIVAVLIAENTNALFIYLKLDIRNQALPLARIKKIMKLDEDVKMISAEAPMLFAKAAELFIMELTLRAWVHTEDNKRRTLQRSDIAMAITKYDQFDFLIDIVPREEAKIGISRTSLDNSKTAVNSDQVSLLFYVFLQSV